MAEEKNKNDENDYKDLAQRRLETDFFAEKRLLRALYNTPELLDDTRVSEDLMSSQSTKNIYKALINLREKGITVSRDALLQEYSVIDLNANSYVVDVISDSSTIETDLTDIIDQLKDFQARRSIARNLKDAVKIIESSARLTEEDIEKFQDLIFNAENKVVSQKDVDYHDTMTLKQWFDSYMQRFEKRRNGKVYWFRNYMLDTIVPDGPQPGEIGIIASASGSGKSTVCLNLVNNFIECGIPSMYYSLEMSAETTMDRLLAKRAHIPYSKLKNPGEEFEEVKDAIEVQRKELEENRLFRYSECGSISLNEIKKQVIQFKKEADVEYCIVVIDLLSMVKDFIKFFSGMNMAQGIEAAINVLSNIAKELHIHVIGILQLNRSSEADSSVHSIDDLEKLRPNRAQIKNANAFLERARYVVTTFRKKMYAELLLQEEEYDDMEDLIELSVVKMNNGEIGKIVKGFFDGEHFDIMPIEYEENEMEEMDGNFKEAD